MSERDYSTQWDHLASTGADGAGYVAGDWPPEVSAARFAGEWAQLSRWLDASGARGACLDVGCGGGEFLVPLARRFERAVGMDIAPAMLARAASRLRAAGVDAQLRRADVLTLDERAQYDVVFVGGVLMYVDDERVDGAIDNLRRALAPGGMLVLRETTHRRGRTWNRTRPLGRGLFAPADAPRRPYHACYRPRRALRARLARHGLTVEVHANRHYKLADMANAQLRAIDWVLRGALARDRGVAGAWARRLVRARWWLSLPAYALGRASPLPLWRLDNHWFVCRHA